ncbi:lipopolysaccharide assembly protein LapA domain-containing protein [bacterium]|nr:lipopolysaccharide assembly protein LapA domain-containing protein [bacterium]
MWVIRWFLAVVVILLVLGFALQNSKEQVNIVFVSNFWHYNAVQLWLVIYISFGLGVLFWLIVSIFQVLQLKNEVRKVRKLNQGMQRELDSLRNLPIGDDDLGLDVREQA